MRSIPSLGQVRLLCRSIVLCRLPRSSVIARDGVCLKRLLVTLLANLTLYYFLLLYLGGEGRWVYLRWIRNFVYNRWIVIGYSANDGNQLHIPRYC